MIDPIIATQEKLLDAGLTRQAEARFGTAVAIEGNIAVVGAWREDTGLALTDAGAVYIFVRSGTSWSLERRIASDVSGTQCGFSVAMAAGATGTRIIYGCPNATGGGRAILLIRGNDGIYATADLNPGADIRTGDGYGLSVGVSENDAVGGAPYNDHSGKTDNGAAFFARFSQTSATAINVFTIYRVVTPLFATDNTQFGTGVAIDGAYSVVGAPAPGTSQADAYVFARNGSGNFVFFKPLTRSFTDADDSGIDSFGQKVAIGGSTIVVAAPLHDAAGGVDSGAAYVFDVIRITAARSSS